MRLVIAGGRLIDPASNVDGVRDIAIAGGRVVAVAGPGQLQDFEADTVVSAEGQWVLPGLVDLSVRLREPGYEYRATLESELMAAVAGGVSSVVCPPDTDPVLDEPSLIEQLKFKALQVNLAKVYPLAALTTGLKGQTLTEMAELHEAGCVGFSQAEKNIADTRVLVQAMRYARDFNLRIHLRPSCPYLSQGGVAHAGQYAMRMGLSGVPVMAETIALHTIFEGVRNTGAAVHVCRISSAAGVSLVRKAKVEGLPITCDVGIHHVHLSDLDIGFFDSHAHLIPPLREQRDRDAIVQGLNDGTIDAICSDHTPVDDDAKLLPFAEAEPGATGLELLLPLTLKWMRAQHKTPLDVVRLLSQNPAGIIGVRAGALGIGMPADLCVFNPDAEWVVGTDTLISQGKHTPFLGYALHGRVVGTWVQGVRVYQFN